MTEPTTVTIKPWTEIGLAWGTWISGRDDDKPIHEPGAIGHARDIRKLIAALGRVDRARGWWYLVYARREGPDGDRRWYPVTKFGPGRFGVAIVQATLTLEPAEEDLERAAVVYVPHPADEAAYDEGWAHARPEHYDYDSDQDREDYEFDSSIRLQAAQRLRI